MPICSMTIVQGKTFPIPHNSDQHKRDGLGTSRPHALYSMPTDDPSPRIDEVQDNVTLSGAGHAWTKPTSSKSYRPGTK